MIRKILVPVDLGPGTTAAVAMAQAQAKAFGAAVELLHVAAPEPDFVGYGPGPQHERDRLACDLRAERAALTELKSQLAAAGLEVTERMYQGVPEQKIAEEVRRAGADLVVLGLTPHSWLYRMWIGGVGEELYHNPPCPLLFVPAQAQPPQAEDGEVTW